MVELDVTGDFDIFDYRRAITLIKKDSAGRDVETAITYALRRAIPQREATESDGLYTTRDTRFHFETEDGSPLVGDRIRDEDGRTYTILLASYDTLASRWKCVSRELNVFYNLDTILEIEKAEIVQDASGAPEPEWSTIARVTGSLTELSSSDDSEQERGRYGEQIYEAVLSTDTRLSPAHRIKDLEGNVYQVTASANKDSINSLQSATCVPYPNNLRET